jgi:hypothetical protein
MVRTGSEAFPSGHFRMVRSGDRKLGRKLRVMPDAPIHNVAVAPNTEPDAPPKTPPQRNAAPGNESGRRAHPAQESIWREGLLEACLSHNADDSTQ